jgi:glucokinase
MLAAGREYEEKHDFRPPDAIKYASVIRHAAAQRGDKVSLTRDHKGFADPDIRSELNGHNVKLITDFAAGWPYVERTLAS